MDKDSIDKSVNEDGLKVTDEAGMTMDQFIATKGYKTYGDFGSNVMYVKKIKR